jgi:hypothetical protein
VTWHFASGERLVRRPRRQFAASAAAPRPLLRGIRQPAPRQPGRRRSLGRRSGTRPSWRSAPPFTTPVSSTWWCPCGRCAGWDAAPARGRSLINRGFAFCGVPEAYKLSKSNSAAETRNGSHQGSLTPASTTTCRGACNPDQFTDLDRRRRNRLGAAGDEHQQTAAVARIRFSAAAPFLQPSLKQELVSFLSVRAH